MPAGLSVLEIGCGAGGIGDAVVTQHGAGLVIGIDVEDSVLTHTRTLADRCKRAGCIGVVNVALAAQAFRVLRLGGCIFSMAAPGALSGGD